MAVDAIVAWLSLGVSISTQPTCRGEGQNKEITPAKSRLLDAMAKLGCQLDKICDEIKCKSMGTPVRYFPNQII